MRNFDLEPLTGSNNYYLLSISDNGDLLYTQSEINIIDRVKEGITKPLLVKVNDKLAFQKDSGDIDDSDDLEMVVNYLGRIIGVKMAETFRCLNSTGVAHSLISMDVAQSDEVEFVSMFEIRDRVVSDIKNGKIERQSWMDQYIKLMQTKAYPKIAEAFESLADKESDVKLAIDVGVYIIDTLTNVSVESKKQMKKDYLKMIFLDALICQVDRTMNNYGLLYNRRSKVYSFAPLFDNATLIKPYSAPEQCLVNGVVCKRSDVLKYLLWDKGYMMHEFVCNFINNKHCVLKNVLFVSAQLLSDKQNQLFVGRLLKGVSMISATLSQQKNNHYTKEY